MVPPTVGFTSNLRLFVHLSNFLYHTYMLSPTLPADEIAFLDALPQHLMQARLAMLHRAGWSLSTIGRSFNPPKPKTTIHFWIKNSINDPSLSRRAVPAPPLSITAAVPTPRAPRTRSISPRVPPDLRPRLRELGTLARRYRAKTPSSSPLAQANRELTDLALTLRSRGVSTADIADAAGVSYRAMARRIALGSAAKKKQRNEARP